MTGVFRRLFDGVRQPELRPYLTMRVAFAAANALPEVVAVPVVQALGRVAARVLAKQSAIVAHHQGRAQGGFSDSRTERRAVSDAFASYGRYWVESLRVGRMSVDTINSRFSIEGLGYIKRSLAAGRGAILAIPHVGGWDVGGAWFVAQGLPMTVVMEALEPPELREWFVALRRSLGLGVVALGPSAGTGVVRALRANQVVALLADRDIAGGGTEVEFFGERTTLPAGPVALAQRLGVALMPTAIYFDGAGHHTVVRPPLDLDGDVDLVTQRLASELEGLIRRAPEQWHLFQPNWPSDRV